MTTKTKLFPETTAGGYSRVDGTIQFYTRIRALVKPEHTVLDLGAGRGVGLLEDVNDFRRDLRNLRGRCAEVIGCDVDPVVMTNPGLDRAFMIGVDGALDLPDASVDLVISDYVLEHIENPEAYSAEVGRVLKPGGWFCARTPNYWGYISIASRMIPNRLHARALARVQNGRKEEDVFPTWYRMNTASDLLRNFAPSQLYL